MLSGWHMNLQAVCFLRPTRENIARIRRELRDPRYGQYHLCAPAQVSNWMRMTAWLSAQAPSGTRHLNVHTVSVGAVFTNRLEDLRIQELAEEDRKEAVLGVQVSEV